jgi:hypothetical protein
VERWEVLACSKRVLNECDDRLPLSIGHRFGGFPILTMSPDGPQSAEIIVDLYSRSLEGSVGTRVNLRLPDDPSPGGTL